MSYILDALKKSQAAREGTDPARATDVYVQALGTLRRSRTFIWMSLGLMVVNLAAVAGWFWYTREQSPAVPDLVQSAPAQSPSPSHTADAVSPAAPRTDEPALRALPSLPAAIAVPQTIPEPEPLAEVADAVPASPHLALTETPSAARARNAVVEPARQRERDIPPADEPARAAADTVETGTAANSARVGGTATNADVPWLAESDTLLQQRFLNLKLDVHVYADKPEDRFIFISMAKYREGDATPNGLHVEEIMPDGVVLSYTGTRFRFPAQ